MWIFRFAPSAASIACGLLIASQVQAQSYSVTQVGAGSATGINDYGQVVGISNGGTTAFFTDANGQNPQLLSLPVSGISSVSIHINDSGQLGGGYTAFQTDPVTNLATFQSGYFISSQGGQSVQTFGVHGLFNVASINASGQLVGNGVFANGGIQQAFITGNNGQGFTSLFPLSTSQGVGEVSGANDSGQVVGYRIVTDKIYGNISVAFMTGQNGQGIIDLPGSQGIGSGAKGINNLGQVVGSEATATGSAHAFITGPGGQGMTDLGSLGGGQSGAFGINETGQVVGYSLNAAGQTEAFVTGSNGQDMRDLNSLVALSSGTFLQQAVAINNLGQIVANGSDGQIYLLTPVPEANTGAMLGLGLGLLAAMRRKRQAPTYISD